MSVANSTQKFKYPGEIECKSKEKRYLKTSGPYWGLVVHTGFNNKKIIKK
jgi:hypothetical protein